MPRKPPTRTQTSQVNIRLTMEQRARLEAATAKLVEGVRGARVPLSRWLLELGLAEADRILGPARK
jgi:hypothetical protein